MTSDREGRRPKSSRQSLRPDRMCSLKTEAMVLTSQH